MHPIVDFFVAWHAAAVLAVTVLAIVCFQWTRGRLLAFLLVGTVAVLLQLMAAIWLLKSDPRPAVVAAKAEWTTDMRQGWSLR